MDWPARGGTPTPSPDERAGGHGDSPCDGLSSTNRWLGQSTLRALIGEGRAGSGIGRRGKCNEVFEVYGAQGWDVFAEIVAERRAEQSG